MLSPYFVLHDVGVKALGDVTKRHVHVAVQAGYAPYCVPRLREGVELYEFKPIQQQGEGRPRAGLLGSKSRASLHAKAYMIDRSILVIGSMNLDPRSAMLNTELALVIHSDTIAGQAARLFDRGIPPDLSWRVELASAAVQASLLRTG